MADRGYWYGSPFPHILLGWQKGREEERSRALSNELTRLNVLGKFAKATKEKGGKPGDFTGGLYSMLSLTDKEAQRNFAEQYKSNYGINLDPFVGASIGDIGDVKKGTEVTKKWSKGGPSLQTKTMPEIKVGETEADIALKKAREAYTDALARLTDEKEITEREGRKIRRRLAAVVTAKEKRGVLDLARKRLKDRMDELQRDRTYLLGVDPSRELYYASGYFTESEALDARIKDLLGDIDYEYNVSGEKEAPKDTFKKTFKETPFEIFKRRIKEGLGRGK